MVMCASFFAARGQEMMIHYHAVPSDHSLDYKTFVLFWLLENCSISKIWLFFDAVEQAYTKGNVGWGGSRLTVVSISVGGYSGNFAKQRTK
jgi:hypothetical protein